MITALKGACLFLLMVALIILVVIGAEMAVILWKRRNEE